jgi:CheY-like chemotaxis protein
MSRLSILIVDDETMVRDIIGAVLRKRVSGRDLLFAEDSKEAIEVFRENSERIGLVITDLSMAPFGALDGIKLLFKLDQLATSFVGAVVLSGYLDDQVKSIVLRKNIGPRESFLLRLEALEKPDGLSVIVGLAESWLEMIEERRRSKRWSKSSLPRLPDGEADFLAFEARMREMIPAYRPGDRVDFLGEEFEVSSYYPEGMPGYWLKGSKEELFLPIDLEGMLLLVVD